MNEPTQPIGPERKLPPTVTYTVEWDTVKNEVQVRGPIQQKAIAIKVLTHAINIIVNYKPPIIEKLGKALVNGLKLAN